MIKLTKELRALKRTNEFVDVGSPREIHINPEHIILIEPIKYPWGMGTHVMVMAGGNPLTFVVSETPDEILEKRKFDSF